MKKTTNKITYGETNEQQTNNKQITTNKNDKNDKNDKEDKNTAEIIKCYEENIGLITPASAEKLFSYLDNMNYELIIEAIKISAIRNKRTTAYISGILNDWNRKGYKIITDIQIEQQKDNNHKEETEEEKKQRKLRELEEAMKNDRW